MLSKQLLRQFEAASSANDRALDANEKSLDLLEKQLAREAERNEWMQRKVSSLEELVRDLAKVEHNNVQVLKAFIHAGDKRILEILELLEKQIENVAQVAGVPRGTVPTVEELLAEARADPARRAALESFMQEAEFADTEINYH